MPLNHTTMYVYDAMGNRIAKILKPDGSSFENGGTNNPTLWRYTYYVRDAQGNIMANYQKSTANSITSFKLIERSIYGSSRLGIDKTQIDLTASITPPTILNHNLGLKNYELSNHLGNITTVISDTKIPRAPLGSNTTIAFYMPDIVSATDYYPFGMTMQERTFSAGGEAYRFGFNGKENDAESNTQDYGMRIYDGRLGRFLSVDPICIEFPELSCYQFASNTPMQAIDFDGLEAVNINSANYNYQWSNGGNGDHNTDGLNIIKLNITSAATFAFEPPIAKKIISHYGYGGGMLMNLNESEMKSIHPSPIGLKNARIAGQIYNQTARYASSSSTHVVLNLAIGVANVAGTLGQFEIQIDGTYTKLDDGSWSFEGKMRFHDIIDFDMLTPQQNQQRINQTGMGRSELGESQVAFAAKYMAGKPYEVFSEWVDVSQTSESPNDMLNWFEGVNYDVVPSKISKYWPDGN